ncbi:MAG: nucleoside hydrolase [Pseudomonadales bacterium]|jgi:inosine-uridine nucleoside N-ribohydrolase|nr:nucleoside hydrolase [Pseudomonadales bacterium]MDP6470190.1 nucleoside hydrolase [Pseudomonadales bacterium]MDP6827096.1 nucleoside hydrolase [Pseudomonadales bacterium]MDP6971534.1 nucleoside hydrolase [Pseudomonadales bacterium]|tara:strand:- start:1463 stop:2437 length:975 start_codon:yes stop_codon:yes gene_type:complete
MRIIIDTDPAMGTLAGDPEDSFAIMLAINSPEVDIEGITVVQGNVPAEKGFSNASHLLDLLGRQDVPLKRGCLRPMNPRRSTQIRWLERRYDSRQIVEKVEPTGKDADAVSFLLETVLAAPGEISLVTIGPLTNVAVAMQRSPDFARSVKRIVMMGGTAECAGNISPAAEFNYWQDPDAADIVFRSGADLTMVGLDVCHQTHLSPEQLQESTRSGTALGKFVQEATEPWFNARSRGGSRSLHLYDSLATAVAINANLVTLEDSYVEIETGDGPAQGMSVSHHKRFQRAIFGHAETNARVALDVEAETFSNLFRDRVLAFILNER